MLEQNEHEGEAKIEICTKEQHLDNDEKGDNLLLKRANDNRVKKRKRGIIYLSTIPKFMNVSKVRETLSKYGEVGRIFLQPAETDKTKSVKKKKPSKHFTEGWVEFQSKRVAKQVALHLNNSQIGGRKKSKFYDHIWSIKYLPRFKWVHLSERLAYERAVHRQRLRAEISQAKREANYFSHNMDKSEKINKMDKVSYAQGTVMVNKGLPWYQQRETDGEIRLKKKIKHSKAATMSINKSLNSKSETLEQENRSEFLRNLFSSE